MSGFNHRRKKTQSHQVTEGEGVMVFEVGGEWKLAIERSKGGGEGTTRYLMKSKGKRVEERK